MKASSLTQKRNPQGHISTAYKDNKKYTTYTSKMLKKIERNDLYLGEVG